MSMTLQVISRNPITIGNELATIFSIKEIGPPVRYLGADVRFVNGHYHFYSKTYLNEVIEQLRTEGHLIRQSMPEASPSKDDKVPITPSTPMQPNDHPEMDESDLLSDRDHQIYMRLIGILQWMVMLGRFDICYSVSSLSRFSKCTQDRTPTESEENLRLSPDCS